MTQTKFAQAHHVRPQWKSRLGFILAAVGSAIGMGNIWRFSYLCYKNGGGAFLIPYFIALLIVGIPLMILEFGIGHKMRGSAPLSLARIDRRWEWLGWMAVLLVMFGIMFYYSTVIAWCLSYVFLAMNQSWGADTNDFFFNHFLRISSGPFEIGDLRFPIVCALFGVWLISWMIVFFGVQNGVERANKIFMPALFILVLILVVWSVNLEGAWIGLQVYLQPDFKKLTTPGIWLDAFSQIFFDLSLGFGIMITYASYLPKNVNLVKDAFIVSFSNAAFSLVAGLAVFGTLGYMAHSTGQPIKSVVKESIGLAFVAYPQAISLLPGFGTLFGVAFFLMLVIAGISSGISILESFTSAIIDKFHFPRRGVVTVLCMTGFIGSLIFTSNGGMYWLDIADHFITHYGLIFVGILQCVAVAWIWKASRLRKHINQCAPGSLSAIWDFCVTWITPAVLTGLLFKSFVTDLNAPYGGYAWNAVLMIGPAWVIFALVGSLVMSMYPWRMELQNHEIH